VSLGAYRKHRQPRAHDLGLTGGRAAEQAWERGGRRALLLSLLALLLAMLLVNLLPLVLVSG